MWWFKTHRDANTARNPGESRGLKRISPCGGDRFSTPATQRADARQTPVFAGVTMVFAAGLFLSLALTSCGFHPMYGDKSDAATNANYSNVDILNIPNRDGQYLRNQLIDRMYLDGRPAETLYTLKVSPIKTLTTNIGIAKDATSTRAMAEVDTTIQLIDNATNKVLLQRDIRATGGYNLLDNQFATIVSRQAVDEHMLEEVADDIVTELGLYFHRASNTPGQMPVSIAKPTRSPSVPIAAPAVGAQPGPIIRNDTTPVTP